jgi:hypothetical protein
MTNPFALELMQQFKTEHGAINGKFRLAERSATSFQHRPAHSPEANAPWIASEELGVPERQQQDLGRPAVRIQFEDVGVQEIE